MPLYWACFKISARPMRLIGRFFILASVWAKSRCGRTTRRPLIDGCGQICSGDSERLYLERRGDHQIQESARQSCGLAEFLVFSCERAAGFCQDVHGKITAYFDALVRMFEQALEATADLTGNVQNGFLARLDRVRSIGRPLGNGVGEDMDVLLCEFDLSVHARGASWK